MKSEEVELEYERMIKKSSAEYPNDAEIIRTLVELKG